MPADRNLGNSGSWTTASFCLTLVPRRQKARKRQIVGQDARTSLWRLTVRWDARTPVSGNSLQLGQTGMPGCQIHTSFDRVALASTRCIWRGSMAGCTSVARYAETSYQRGTRPCASIWTRLTLWSFWCEEVLPKEPWEGDWPSPWGAWHAVGVDSGHRAAAVIQAATMTPQPELHASTPVSSRKQCSALRVLDLEESQIPQPQGDPRTAATDWGVAHDTGHWSR